MWRAPITAPLACRGGVSARWFGQTCFRKDCRIPKSSCEAHQNHGRTSALATPGAAAVWLQVSIAPVPGLRSAVSTLPHAYDKGVKRSATAHDHVVSLLFDAGEAKALLM